VLEANKFRSVFTCTVSFPQRRRAAAASASFPTSQINGSTTIIHHTKFSYSTNILSTTLYPSLRCDTHLQFCTPRSFEYNFRQLANTNLPVGRCQLATSEIQSSCFHVPSEHCRRITNSIYWKYTKNRTRSRYMNPNPRTTQRKTKVTRRPEIHQSQYYTDQLYVCRV
jgi:hypothetical protein